MRDRFPPQLPLLVLALASAFALFQTSFAEEAEEKKSLLIGHLVPKEELAPAESQQVAVVADHDLETAAGTFSVS